MTCRACLTRSPYSPIRGESAVWAELFICTMRIVHPETGCRKHLVRTSEGCSTSAEQPPAVEHQRSRRHLALATRLRLGLGGRGGHDDAVDGTVAATKVRASENAARSVASFIAPRALSSTRGRASRPDGTSAP